SLPDKFKNFSAVSPCRPSQPAKFINVPVSDITHFTENRRATRITNASNNPSRLALFCCASGSLPLKMEIKTMLSMPNTISSTVSVSSDIQISGSKNQSISECVNVNVQI